MAYNFFINKNSTLPSLRMEVINDGRHNFKKLYDALQSADVYFSMTDVNSGIKRIVNAKADVVAAEKGNCDEQYLIEYRWKDRDTKTPGVFRGQFKIVFDDKSAAAVPSGTLIVPISEELIITINEGCIKK